MSLDTLAQLEAADAAVSEDMLEKPFGPFEEEAIVSLALDFPEFIMGVADFIQPQMFKRLETQYVMAELLTLYKKHSTIPTRTILYDVITRKITEDERFEPVLEIINRKSNPREVPVVKDLLLKWARNKAYGQLFSEESHEAYCNGNFDYLEELIRSAGRIADITNTGLWLFESLDLLLRPDVVEHRTTGFTRLDRVLNNGGPSPGETLIWMAATNVGKSIMLCNNAISSLTSTVNGVRGQNVLLVTLELDRIKTALRCLASATKQNVNTLPEHAETIRRVMATMRTTYHGKDLCIHELSPEECSVSHIYAVIDNLKRVKGWKPDVVVVDYLDLLMSRNPHYNTDDYKRLKHVASELRGLAINEKILLFTATQTNRGGTKREELVTIDKAGESYGKTMSADYIVSLNQSEAQAKAVPPHMALLVIKNRNGPRDLSITCNITYNLMKIEEAG